MRESLNIAIAGATGYVGLELVRLLSKHPKVKITYLCAQKNIGKSINKFFKKKIVKRLPTISKISKVNWKKINVLFTALPNGEAQKIVNLIYKFDLKIIDLSADFRISNFLDYKKWYGIDHKSVDFINNSIYSITEFSRKKLPRYKIISCAGCYPTSIQLPLIPLIEKKMIDLKNIIIDSKSGYSGGGKNINKKFKSKNIYNSVIAYGVGSHRHVPEINQELSKVAKKKVKVHFTPHLIPMFRGILSTVYVKLEKKLTPIKIYKFLKKYHKKNSFIDIAKFNKPIGTGDVLNTNKCKISVCKDISNDRVIILSAIDNLLKGASGQAVQNMNAAFKFNELTGLK